MRTICLLVVTAAAFAQDPYQLLSKNYTLEFENDYVRISRVRFSPGDRLPVHSHPAIPTVYVYLMDGGPIRFIHKTPKFTLERPAVKVGGVRFNRNAQVETHEVEYLGDAATEYLRIELKTEPGPRHRDARLRTDADFPWEDPQVRISRVRGKLPGLTTPAVIVDLTGRNFTWFDPSTATMNQSEPGANGLVLLELKTARLPA